MEAHEAHEQHEHLEHTAHGHGSGSGKRIAILISILAALLAIVESGGKSAQTEQLARNIDVSDTYAFYQAKTIRKAVMQNAADMIDLVAPEGQSPAKAAKVADAVANWKKEMGRLDSDPERKEGRKELLERAKTLAVDRDRAAMAYHNFEYGSAALQLGIVLASASVITSMPVLAAAAAGLGVIGVGFGGLGWFAPELLHTLLHGHPEAGGH